MVKRTVEIINESGLHCRPGNQFVKLAQTYTADVNVKKGDKKFNGKSLLKLMKIGISKGDCVEIICTGNDEEKALNDLCYFISNLRE